MSCGCRSSSSCCSCNSCTPTCASSCQCSTSCTNCATVCTALVAANAWNVPACSASAVLSFPGLTTILLGSYLYNPTYGQFRVTAFNSTNGEVTVVNDCFSDNAAPGTVVPALTEFIFSGPALTILENGWMAAGETWTYLSANSVTVPTDATDKYSVGDKIWFVQSGADKWFSVVDVSPTVLTFAVNTDYVVTNVAISEPQYSHAESPLYFPPYFNYDGAPAGFSADPADAIYTFRVLSTGYVSVDCIQPNSGTSDDTVFTIAAPVTAKTVTGGQWGAFIWEAVDNGLVVTSAAKAVILSAGTSITLYTTIAGGAWTNVSGKRASFTNLVYPI